MKDNQKGSGVIIGLLILVIVGTLGFIAWEIWRPQHPKDNTNKTSSTGCPTIRTTNNRAFQQPNGWSWYEANEIGLKYAYPKNWGSATTQTNSGIQQYAASFTNSSSGANIMVILSPDCSDFQSTLSDINNGKLDMLDDSITTKAIKHNQSSYSLLSHWSSDADNQYKLLTNSIVSVDSIKSVVVDYSIATGAKSCPDDRLASSDQRVCINQTISDEVDKVISSLQKI